MKCCWITARFALGVTIAGCVSSKSALATSFVIQDEQRADSTAEQSRDGSLPLDSHAADEADELAIDNPGSIPEELRQDARIKDSLLKIPAIDDAFKPWFGFKADLDEAYGIKFGLSFTHLYQRASDAVGSEDDASGFELVFDGTWNFLGRGTDSPTIAGFEVLYRDRMATDIPPVALFTQISSLYPTTVAFGEVNPSLGQFWIQQKFDNRIGFQVGKLFPIAVYDFFPFKNFRTDFVDGVHAANLVIPLPDRGLGGFVMYRPQPNVYVRAGFHDANADAESSGFDSLFDEGELFTIFEAGFDPGLMERQPGRPPFGDVHVSVWHQDERDDANVDDAWGLVLSGSQRFGRFTPFVRYGYSDGGAKGPTPMEHVVNAGVGIDNIFGQRDDRIGVGLTWSRPTDGALDDQGAVDVFYRIQVSPRIAVTPTLQWIIDPVRNPDEDQVVVLGIRTRFEF